jgi:outer membrane protein TolC
MILLSRRGPATGEHGARGDLSGGSVVCSVSRFGEPAPAPEGCRNRANDIACYDSPVAKAFALAVALGLFSPAAGSAQIPLALDDALAESRASNARLPIPAFDVAVAREKASEARAERWLKVAVEGDFIYAPTNGYDPAITNAGEGRAQVVARQSIYDGGARRAAVARGEADVDAAGARFRMAEKDLELDVRSRFAEWVHADAEAGARREGIDRLLRYRTSLQSRRASGQGVGADLIRIDVRLAAERAAIVDADGRRDAARIALNALMGREPAASLALAPLPDPEAPSEDADTVVQAVPDVAEARAQERVADADLATARAEGKPHLSLTADFGFLGSDTTRLVPASLRASDPDATFGDRLRRDLGYSMGLFFTWPAWDFGAIRARLRQAELKLQSARQNVVFQTSEARRQRALAESTLRNVWEQIRILTDASPAARDSYLEAESRYRGGAATALEVLDSYAASVDAVVKLAEARSRYRVARALLLRWTTP